MRRSMRMANLPTGTAARSLLSTTASRKARLSCLLLPRTVRGSLRRTLIDRKLTNFARWSRDARAQPWPRTNFKWEPEASPMSKPLPDPHPATILSRQYGCEIPREGRLQALQQDLSAAVRDWRDLSAATKRRRRDFPPALSGRRLPATVTRRRPRRGNSARTGWPLARAP